MKTTADIITAYLPTLPEDTWTQMRSFVRDTIAASFDDSHAPRSIENALSALSGFADWVLLSGVGELGHTVLRADIIDAYAAARRGEVSSAVGERERKLLRTLAGLPNIRENRAHTTTAPSSAPYERWELDAYRRWTEGQSTPSRRHLATAVLALGAGCGLTSAEMLRVRHTDLVRLSDGMLGVNVDGRCVPVLEEWDDSLATFESASEAFIVTPGRSAERSSLRTSSVMAELDGDAPQAARLRATWLVMHLEACTPLRVLLDAAGYNSPDSLRRTLPFVRRVDEPTAVEALRLTEGGAR